MRCSSMVSLLIYQYEEAVGDQESHGAGSGDQRDITWQSQEPRDRAA